MIAYKVKKLQVVKVDCPDGMEYPQYDADGDKIYINTHYSSKEEAYKRAMGECEAGMSLEALQIERLQKEILTRQGLLTEFAIAKMHLINEQREEASNDEQQ